MTTLAIILTDLSHGRFGHDRSLHDELAGKAVLQHTIDRVARIEGLDGIVLLHPDSQVLSGQYDAPSSGPAITTQPIQSRPGDAWLHDTINAGRKWSLTAWRGGVGGMTIYDELLPAYPLLCAAQAMNADSIVALRADWCCLDPVIAGEQLKLHHSAPEAMKLTFTQAPPGLSPLVIHRSVLQEMADHSATVANLLCYNPKKPVIDPVGKDVNVQVPASVRDQYRRFIYDTPRAIGHLQGLAQSLGEHFVDADAVDVTDASRSQEIDEPWRQFERLPQQFNIELTPRRTPDGPLIPQHHLDLARPEMARETIDALLEQLPAAGDTAVLFGGLGDALLHEDWQAILNRACSAGFLGVGIETDLLVDTDTIKALAELPLDVISVRLNADSAKTYEKLMGIDGYPQVMDNLQQLFKHRNANRQRASGFRGWVVPRLVKVADNLKDLETFFERWMTVSGWAVIDRAQTGRGLIPELGPVPMEVPRPPGQAVALHRQKQRLTVLSDGRISLCGQDWLGRLPIGRVDERPLQALWLDVADWANEQQDTDAVCPVCREWIEARQQLLALAGAE